MKYLRIFLAGTAVLLSPFTVSAYHPVTTHAGLTEQIVEFYNYSATKPISKDNMELMIQASINEDFGTRPLNHFYDPIRKIGINGARSAKVWALDGNVVENDFSWPKAIQAYAEGKDDLAVVGLGHILHLIEDMSVPDHTRNDPHKGDGLENGFTGESPYEKWTDETKDRKTLAGLARSYFVGGMKKHTFGTIGEAFDFLANYSNRNFFSRDTIVNSIYSYAYPTTLDADEFYVYSIDPIDKNRYKILKIENDSKGNVEYSLSDRDNFVLSSYFDRLAKQAVLTGAGVIELFFREGEKARAEYKLAQEKAQKEEIVRNEALAKSLASKSYLGLAVAGAGMLWNQYITQPVSTISSKVTNTIALGATGISQATTHYSAFLFSSGAIATQQAKAVATTEINKAKDTLVSATNQLGTIIRQTLNENVTGQAQAATISETLPATNTIASSVSVTETKAVENANTVVVPVIETSPMQAVVTPSFTSGGGGRVSPVPVAEALAPEILLSEMATSTPVTLPTILFVVAECEYSFVADLCAVATTTLALSWSSSSTPDHFQLTLSGVQNEVATTSENHAQVVLSGDGEYSFLIEAYDTATSTTPYASSTQAVLVIQHPVVINEIAWSGTAATSSDQWVELYNNSSHAIDLSKINLSSSVQDFAINLSGTVAPHGYFLLERGSDHVIQDISADLIYEATSTSLLPENGTQLALLWNNTIIDQTPDSTYFGWVAGQSGYQVLSMERFSPSSLGTDMYSWRSNLAYISSGNDTLGNPIYGTPHGRNSIAYLINQGYSPETPVTLTLENSPYVTESGGLTVYSTGSLTIEPGVVIKIYDGSSLYAYGPVYMQGTDSVPIILASLTDTSVAEDVPVRTAMISGDDRFDSVRFYSGSEGSTLSSVHMQSVEDGILFSNTSAVVDGLRISNADHAVTIDGGLVTMNNVQVENIEGDAIDVYDGELILSNSSISGVHNGDAIALYTASSSIDTLSVADIGDGSALGMYDSSATVTNSLFQNGTDDGVELYSSNIHMASSTVRQFQGVGISTYLSEADFSGITISENQIGVEVYGSEVSIDLSNVFGNTDYALYNGDDQSVSAIGNWWGDVTGPYSETDNPTGLGNGVYGVVDFSEWLLEQT